MEQRPEAAVAIGVRQVWGHVMSERRGSEETSNRVFLGKASIGGEKVVDTDTRGGHCCEVMRQWRWNGSVADVRGQDASLCRRSFGATASPD